MFELDQQAEKSFDVSEPMKKPYVNEKEAAAITGRSVFTLRNERHLRRGLPYLKISCWRRPRRAKNGGVVPLGFVI